jgi:hypothetical protein
MSMHVLRPSRRQLIFLISLSTLSGCALNDPVDRPRELAPGAGCHDISGSYANVSETLSGHLLSRLFFDQETALRHLEITDKQQGTI